MPAFTQQESRRPRPIKKYTPHHRGCLPPCRALRQSVLSSGRVSGTNRTSSTSSWRTFPSIFVSLMSFWIPRRSPTGITKRPPSLSWSISGCGNVVRAHRSQ